MEISLSVVEGEAPSTKEYVLIIETASEVVAAKDPRVSNLRAWAPEKDTRAFLAWVSRPASWVVRKESAARREMRPTTTRVAEISASVNPLNVESFRGLSKTGT